MRIGRLSFRAHCHATESLEKVEKSVIFVSGRKDIKKKTMHGCYGNPIIVMTVMHKSNRESMMFWKRIAEECYSDAISEIDKRIDEYNNLYLRFSKQEAYLGRLKMISGGDAISVRGKIPVFPNEHMTACEKIIHVLENFKI